MSADTAYMYQTWHLQNTDSLYEPNIILRNTDSCAPHSQGKDTEWLFLACPEK